MKRVKQMLSVLVFAIALFISAFTLSKKKEQKLTSLYWYAVTYDQDHPNGIILSSSDFFVHEEKANVSSPCGAGNGRDCLRGFTSQLSNFPVISSGIDQITTYIH